MKATADLDVGEESLPGSCITPFFLYLHMMEGARELPGSLLLEH